MFVCMHIGEGVYFQQKHASLSKYILAYLVSGVQADPNKHIWFGLRRRTCARIQHVCIYIRTPSERKRVMDMNTNACSCKHGGDLWRVVVYQSQSDPCSSLFLGSLGMMFPPLFLRYYVWKLASATEIYLTTFFAQLQVYISQFQVINL